MIGGFRRCRLGWLALAVSWVWLVRPAWADNACHQVEVHFTPAENLQLVAWVEDPAGIYVDTAFITAATGTYGLGNRPGLKDFNSSPLWPYGRREMTFPIWAHKHGKQFPLVVFQNGDERNLSHPFGQSSREAFYCRPLKREEAAWDTATCASSAYTDKGRLDETQVSLYPPREDVVKQLPDSHSAAQFAALNPFDAVSKATPQGGEPYVIRWPLPSGLPAGRYVLNVEAAQEFDHNATYSPTAYPAPAGIPWAEYGLPFRGQPSVLYQVPFELSAVSSEGRTEAYAGYGDPDGLDGTVRPPDASISTSTPGSGAARLALTPDGHGELYRVRVVTRPERDAEAPAAPTSVEVLDVTAQTASLRFVSPGDDGMAGTVAGYEVRVLAEQPMTGDNFMAGTPIIVDVAPVAAGQAQTLALEGLLPLTRYAVGLRAYDNCRNTGPVQVVYIETPARLPGEVDACFVATAVFGTSLAAEVVLLRGLRDRWLASSVLGQAAIATYYAMAPPAADLIGTLEPLRHAARALLEPLVKFLRPLRMQPS